MDRRGFEPRTSALPRRLLASLPDFYRFMTVQRELTENTASCHYYRVRKFLRSIPDRPVSQRTIEEFLSRISVKSSKAGYLKALKLFFGGFRGERFLVDGFKYPVPDENPTPCPSDKAVREVFWALEDPIEQTFYLLCATSGLRRGEIRALTPRDVDAELRCIAPGKVRRTKKTGISFYNEEAEELILENVPSLLDGESRAPVFPKYLRRKQWVRAWEKVGVKVTPQMLRVWFSAKMGELGVQDRYVDIFQGRAPRSVLAKYYTPREKLHLKQIYDRAGLRVLD